MAGPKASWAQVVTNKTKISTPYKETYHRRGADPMIRLFHLERLVRDLIQSSSQLQKENKSLRDRLSILEEMASQEVDIKEEIAKEVIEECISKPDQRLISFLQSAVNIEGNREKSKEEHIKEEEEIQKKIQSSLAEERERTERALNIRFGGMDKGLVESWYQQKDGRAEHFARHFQDSLDIRIAGITKVNLYGPQVVLTLRSKQERTDILRQAHKLRGTKIWMAEDLTKEQLNRKKGELLKVKQARSDGFWAKYQNGEAVIREFKEARRAK